MDKTWSYTVPLTSNDTGTFVIKSVNADYILIFCDQWGNVVHLYNDKNLPEIWSYLLTIKTIKTKNAIYSLDMSKLGIPTDLTAWSVEF